MAYQAFNYSWEYYPPPYDFLSPTCPPAANPAMAQASGWSGGIVPRGHSGKGFGSCCQSCASGGACTGHDHGLGQLFASGLDYTQWGWGEWAAVAVGAYLVINLAGDIMSGTRKVTRTYKRVRSRSKKKAQLQSRLSLL